jgi:hypothetical protein
MRLYVWPATALIVPFFVTRLALYNSIFFLYIYSFNITFFLYFWIVLKNKLFWSIDIFKLVYQLQSFGFINFFESSFGLINFFKP